MVAQQPHTQQPLTQENYIKLQAKENCSKVMVIQCLKRVVQPLHGDERNELGLMASAQFALE